MESPPFGILPLSEGWDRIYKMGVLPLQQSVEGRGSELWGANKFIMVYDLVFKMCIQRDPYNYSEQIYNHYCEAVGRYVSMGELELRRAASRSAYRFLEEFYLRWSRFLTYMNRMTKVFGYLDRFYTPNSMLRSTGAEGTHQFGTLVLHRHLDGVLEAARNIYIHKNDAQDLNAVRFALAALIDAYSMCDTRPADGLKILACLRLMWSSKMSGELLGVLPSFFKGGLVKMIVDYACPESFLERLRTPEQHSSSSNPWSEAVINVATPRTARPARPVVAGPSERVRGGLRVLRRGDPPTIRRGLAGDAPTVRRHRPLARRETRGPPPASSSTGEGRRIKELRRLLRSSFLSVFGHEHLEWGNSDDDSKGAYKTGPLLVRYAKELYTLHRTGFTDRRRNLAVLRWTWGNLDEAIAILSKPSGQGPGLSRSSARSSVDTKLKI
ncbi:hypothetical protein AAMO2058_000968200 [Amorphochlora amoebiformis]